MSLEAQTEALAVSQKVYVDEAKGVDSPDTTGTSERPYASSAYAYWKTHSELLHIKKPSEAESTYELISPSALKKAKKGADGLEKKAAKAAKADQDRAAQQEAEQARIEASKTIQIVDSSTPATKTKIRHALPLRGKRVSVSGWIHRLRAQKGLVFIVLRDGSGLLQCVLSGDLANAYQTSQLSIETTIEIKGELKELPDGKSAPGGHELVADFYKVYSLAPGGADAFTNKVSEDAGPSILMDNRHLTLRGDSLSSVMKVRAALLAAFRAEFNREELVEVTPPCMVQSMVEGGSTLFQFDYYGEPAYLTQSSQLYLETVVPSMGDCYCIQESFRAERSKTRRHLSEFTHVEAELGFLTFDDLLDHLERFIVGVVNRIVSDPATKELVEFLNPGFQPPKLPFRRMKYAEAIEWLNEHKVINSDTGEAFKFGDDISEAEERHMTDTINEPIFLTHFPVEIKSFYMSKDPEDPRVTLSVDCLMPNVGEVIGGSMRIDSYEELMAAFKREQIDPSAYYWFIDLRKYGSFPHGGYGLGLERILAWICNRFTVRECTLYPRYTGRCKP